MKERQRNAHPDPPPPDIFGRLAGRSGDDSNEGTLHDCLPNATPGFSDRADDRTRDVIGTTMPRGWTTEITLATSAAYCKPLLAGLGMCRRRAYIDTVNFEWDPRKADANLRKLNVDFADAANALEDEHAITIPDPASALEERFVTVGMDPLGRVLVVVYTWRSETIRLISARTATRREARQYGEWR
jgi:uncharacterized DUF497 family protein